jgi:hypothetical protein
MPSLLATRVKGRGFRLLSTGRKRLARATLNDVERFFGEKKRENQNKKGVSAKS